jgi:hypothetical protein
MPSPFIKIKIDTETGKKHQVTKDDNGQPDTVTKLPDGAERIAEIFFAHNSPGCVYYVQGGRIFRVCS